jgi:hypothetical protein
MAETVARETKFRDAGLELADDAVDFAAKIRKYIRAGNYEAAEKLAHELQQTSRDVKWLMRRQPKK